MRDFFARHAYLVIWIAALIIIGAAAVLVIQMNAILPSSPTMRSQTGGVTTPAQPAAPLATSVSISIEKTKSGNVFFIQWKNLPAGTAALNIFREPTGMGNAMWSIWKTISIPSDELADGSAMINLGSADETGYSFSVQAVNQSGTPTNGTSTQEAAILWTSSSTIPAVTTSTPQQSGTPASTSTPGTTPTSTSQAPAASSSVSQNNPPAPTGTPYYNPQIQISAYGAPQTGNFWVQHVDQKIQIGWQSLPPETTDIVISRSQNQDGPWATVLTQKNPGTAGAYSIQLVDDTLGIPYYYQMATLKDSTTLATYGPVYLASN